MLTRRGHSCPCEPHFCGDACFALLLSSIEFPQTVGEPETYISQPETCFQCTRDFVNNSCNTELVKIVVLASMRQILLSKPTKIVFFCFIGQTWKQSEIQSYLVDLSSIEVKFSIEEKLNLPSVLIYKALQREEQYSLLHLSSCSNDGLKCVCPIHHPLVFQNGAVKFITKICSSISQITKSSGRMSLACGALPLI